MAASSSSRAACGCTCTQGPLVPSQQPACGRHESVGGRQVGALEHHQFLAAAVQATSEDHQGGAVGRQRVGTRSRGQAHVAEGTHAGDDRGGTLKVSPHQPLRLLQHGAGQGRGGREPEGEPCSMPPAGRGGWREGAPSGMQHPVRNCPTCLAHPPAVTLASAAAPRASTGGMSVQLPLSRRQLCKGKLGWCGSGQPSCMPGAGANMGCQARAHGSHLPPTARHCALTWPSQKLNQSHLASSRQACAQLLALCASTTAMGSPSSVTPGASTALPPAADEMNASSHMTLLACSSCCAVAASASSSTSGRARGGAPAGRRRRGVQGRGEGG